MTGQEWDTPWPHTLSSLRRAGYRYVTSWRLGDAPKRPRPLERVLRRTPYRAPLHGGSGFRNDPASETVPGLAAGIRDEIVRLTVNDQRRAFAVEE
jgi:hypothetical protein